MKVLRVTYYLYDFKRTCQGEVPIYCKMTTDGVKRQQFSIRLYSRPELWDEDANHGVLQYVCVWLWTDWPRRYGGRIRKNWRRRLPN
ncbi:hypothetical protein [uncultured Alistipes sp.]|uniref:hypothetical protein n=1 Tax=uncultured Alistipes sp. TaxID=538949 RepID=UPI0025841923|nr:hypothetical protein [uncultured Alistipes sp.]